MPITQRRYHAPMSRAMIHRNGGSVNLFNYNPSIAGGSIAVRRYKDMHRFGRYLRHKEHDHLIPTTAGTGLHSAGHAAHGGAVGSTYTGLGASGRTSMVPLNTQKRKLHEMIGKMMHPPGADKRMKD